MSAFLLLLLLPSAEPLHVRIDAILDAANKGQPVSPVSPDAEFLRRVCLDLAGTIPDAKTARAFLDDRASDKRAKLIDRLLKSPEHSRRMSELFHVHFMERMGDNPEWTEYLRESFAKNRPFDEMARDILGGKPGGPSFWLTKRLEHYGENPIDYPGLARDVGRLFLGKDLRCAQCHNHLFVKEYKQADFQGLFAFVQNAYIANAAKGEVGEKLVTGKTEFISVFGKKGKQATGPRVPGGKEVAIPAFEKGKEWRVPPDKKKRLPGVPSFSPLAELAHEVPTSTLFARNIANRLWWAFMGRGIVHPLDLHHAGNPPSHPELLDLLAKELVAHKYDMRWLIREIALTRAYQRSSQLPDGVKKLEPAKFRTAIEKRLSAEQLLWATLEAVGNREKVVAAKAPPPIKGKKAPSPLEVARQRFIRAFAGPVREPEEEFSPALKSALFWLNDPLPQAWLQPTPGTLTHRLSALSNDRVAEELYLSVLTRRPDAEESAMVKAALLGKTGKERPRAIMRLVWALLASTEFNVNH
jgi:hypothetical protein